MNTSELGKQLFGAIIMLLTSMIVTFITIESIGFGMLLIAELVITFILAFRVVIVMLFA